MWIASAQSVHSGVGHNLDRDLVQRIGKLVVDEDWIHSRNQCVDGLCSKSELTDTSHRHATGTQTYIAACTEIIAIVSLLGFKVNSFKASYLHCSCYTDLRLVIVRVDITGSFMDFGV